METSINFERANLIFSSNKWIQTSAITYGKSAKDSALSVCWRGAPIAREVFHESEKDKSSRLHRKNETWMKNGAS